MIKLHKSWIITLRSVVLVISTIALSVLVFQTSMIPSRVALSPPFPSFYNHETEGKSPSSSISFGKLSPVSDSRNSTGTFAGANSKGIGQIMNTKELAASNFTSNNLNLQTGKDNMLDDEDDDKDNIDLDGEEPDGEFSFDLGNGVIVKKVKDPEHGFIPLDKVDGPKYFHPNIQEAAPGFSAPMDGGKHNQTFVSDKIKEFHNESALSTAALMPLDSHIIEPAEEVFDTDTGNPINKSATSVPPSEEQAAKVDSPSSEIQLVESLPADSATIPMQAGTPTPKKNFGGNNTPKKRNNKRAMPPLSMVEMKSLLVRNRASYRSMRPRWSSPHDQDILAAKAQIENAPMLTNDQELHEPAFQNLSMFKRSYELMESALKVYVYKEGSKPVFHQPPLKGIYASEGWFMKLLERNKHFVVKDPRKANMFYIPFSSRFLEFALYDSNLHSKKNLVQYLQGYVDMIASKYPFWNRTGGADHFVAACHDWATYETRHTMDPSIRALCNADLREGFRLGKDVSLPETLIRVPRNPLRELGGKPASERTILAFFAGNMHGRLRPVLLQHWQNKDPDMKIFGPMPPGASKMSYSQYMKSSKYCICPRGYEVNSPRIVESIFYECVPVIISDNYVPPFFEVLNWETFSVIIPEVDVPRLKEILMSIPTENYLSLWKGVKKVQKHFLWHSSPVKYDVFHMILHSIWFNRVFTIRAR